MRAFIILSLLFTLSVTGCEAYCEITNIPGCELFTESGPTAEVTELQLTESPSLDLLAAQFCADYFSLPFGATACEAAVGAPQDPNTLDFVVRMGLTIENPLDIPIPALEVLVALTLFPGDDAEALGSMCVGLCGSDDPDCGNAPSDNRCESDTLGVLLLGDMEGTAIPALVEGLASGAANLSLEDTMVVAGGDLRINVDLRLGSTQAIDVIEKMTDQFMEDITSLTSVPRLTIPAQIEGTVFLELPGLGKTGVHYGPFDANWDVL